MNKKIKYFSLLLINLFSLNSCNNNSSNFNEEHFENGFIKEPLYLAIPNTAGTYSFTVFKKDDSIEIYNKGFKDIEFKEGIREEEKRTEDMKIYSFLYGYNDEFDFYLFSDNLCVFEYEDKYYSAFINISIKEINSYYKNSIRYDKADFWNKVNSGEIN